MKLALSRGEEAQTKHCFSIQPLDNDDSDDDDSDDNDDDDDDHDGKYNDDDDAFAYSLFVPFIFHE